jgi:hypothetical protein
MPRSSCYGHHILRYKGGLRRVIEEGIHFERVIFALIALALLGGTGGCASARSANPSRTVASGHFGGSEYRLWTSGDMTCESYGQSGSFCETFNPLLSPSFGAQIDMEQGTLLALVSNSVFYISLVGADGTSVELPTQVSATTPSWRYVIHSAVSSLVSYETMDRSHRVIGSQLCPIGNLGSGSCTAGPG